MRGAELDAANAGDSLSQSFSFQIIVLVSECAQHSVQAEPAFYFSPISLGSEEDHNPKTSWISARSRIFPLR